MIRSAQTAWRYFPWILGRYFATRFTLTTIATILALTGLISLFDFIDLLRRASSHPEVNLTSIFFIAGLHTPYYIIYVLPFGILLGGIVCFARLSRSSELIVARATGLSAWQFLTTSIGCAVLMGGFVSTCLSPLSSMMYRHAEILDETLLRGGEGPMTLRHGSLWLKQSDTGLTPSGEAVLHINNLHLEHDHLYVSGISIFRLDSHAHFLARIEAPQGELFHQRWFFPHAMQLLPAHPPQNINNFSLPSELTVERIRSRSAPPDTLSFWALPKFINLLGKSGFPTIQYRLHLQALLALPILAGTMALISAGFSMRPTRRGGVTRLLGAGITAGFVLFTVSKVAEQLGKSGALPPLLASWAPAGAGLCLAATLLLHMEDG
ncbi:LptF/LptG family permease [Saccharibacter sp. 17.LH.SD]|uniref:LptF/LptG family permease n=1 Tax=Saccharibacter sp. 17.LH.SD TaxID=2689393 RepID=UPI00136C3AC3|nr:LptF/LptG family permease [Saccharibacter sp. 17.LH.SD]MXV44775.1 LptF/LptG family permease [Saccharibacter sp. 17.LH.SD]